MGLLRGERGGVGETTTSSAPSSSPVPVAPPDGSPGDEDACAPAAPTADSSRGTDPTTVGSSDGSSERGDAAANSPDSSARGAAAASSPDSSGSPGPGDVSSSSSSGSDAATGAAATLGRGWVQLDRVGLGTSTLDVRVVSSISKVSREEWDAVVSDAEVNPFLLHDFLLALEDSGSAAPRAGWLAQHVLVYQVGPGEEAGASADGTAAAAAGPSGAPAGRLVGCVPMYLKSHSYGEYVFDSSWANYAEMLGIRYYPKLQAAVPFTPVTGPRLMVSGQLGAADRTAVVKAMGQALIRLADSTNVSGLHVTFSTAQEWAVLAELGFKQRLGIQFHFDNDGYSSFDAFLADLKQSRRKSIRQERKSVAKAGLLVHRLSGTSLTPDHWDRFYSFYLNTCDKKWGNAYLTRDFFQQLGQRLPERVLLVGATEGVHEGAGPVPVPKARELVAGALNLVGSHALYGRNWGCAEGSDVKNLHFELCYYQAQEEAISRGLPRVEAGAQGEHKLQRGYLPSFTYSCHYIRDPRLGYAVDKFLDRERRQIEYTLQVMSLESSPFKKEKTVESLMSKLRAYSILSSGGSSGSSWEVEEEVQEDGE